MRQNALHAENEFARRLFTGLPSHYDLLVNLLSLEQNRHWRRTMVDVVVAERPETVLDVATGTAGVAIQLAERTGASVTGIDLTPAMLERGRKNVVERGFAGRITLVEGRAEDLPFADRSFDALTFTYLLRYVDDPAATLRELARVLKPGGVMAGLDFFVPPNRLWRAAWWLYTRLALPVAGRAYGKEWLEVGRFLGPNISAHYRRYPLDWHIRAWRDADIGDIQVRVMSLGGGLVMWGQKRRG